jgi:hypothetical protein
MLKANTLTFEMKIGALHTRKKKKKERKKDARCGDVPWNCRHVMSSGAGDTTLPSLGSSRDHRDSRESLALSTTVEEV